MAYDFDGTNDRLDYASTGASPSALSGFCWLAGNTGNTYVVCNASSGVTNIGILWWQRPSAPNNLSIQIGNTGGAYDIENWSTALPSAGSAPAAVGFSHPGTMGNLPLCYYNGAAETPNSGSTTTGTWRGWQAAHQVGGRSTDTLRQWNGEMSELTFWDAVLSADEHAALANRISPLLIRPDKIVFYAPLRAGRHDLISGVLGTTANLPTQIEHPYIGFGGPIVVPFDVAAGGSIIPHAMHHYNQMRAH